MPDYREIYNEVISTNPAYNRAENSPGYQTCVRYAERFRGLAGRSLDVGCGVGFVCHYLTLPPFRFAVHGVDISDEAIERTKQRLSPLSEREPERFQRIETGQLPFADDHFSLVTCFDVLEHLDESDIDQLVSEIRRVTRPGGQMLISVSCREAGSVDLHGDNLHRSVNGVDWWLDHVQPEEAVFESHSSQLTLWVQKAYPPG